MVPTDLHLSGFADDHSIRGTFNAGNIQQEKATRDKIEACMLNIEHWMDMVGLKMNPSKTEFIYFGGKQQLGKCVTDNLDVAGDLILRSHSIRYLGAYLDENLSYKQYVNKKMPSGYVQLLQNKGNQEATGHPNSHTLMLKPVHLASGLLQFLTVWITRHHNK